MMQNTLFTSSVFKLILIIVLLGLLVGVRIVEHWFYDPLRLYFEQDYLHVDLPQMNTFKLYINIILRYSINTLISLGVIWIAFQNKGYIIFSVQFYTIALLVLLFVLVILLNTQLQNQNLGIFYVRRFLIQPLFLFLLLPAFHYQNKISKSKI
ncbi:MAG: exosortase F system-associated protein [Flavobacteriaceae bacterium]|nr:exosortase F system-associated protein [Flavobacteriaceae bacterium]